MKTLFAAILLCTMSLGMFAQQTTPQSTAAQKPAVAPLPTPTTKVATDAYRCPVCGLISTKAGECPKDKVSLIKVGDYYCPMCYMTSKKAEKCPMCGIDMKKMEASTKIVAPKN